MIRFVYPIVTGLFVLAMGMSGVLYLTQAAPLVESVHDDLGYPLHFFAIIGTAKLLGVIALAVPGFAKLKEWAYAGFTFNLLGAVWAHLAMGTGPAAIAPAVMAVLLVVSYITRPASRRIDVVA